VNSPDQDKLSDTIDRDEATMGRLTASQWTVAVGISVYGLFIVVPFLTTHHIPGLTAWMLPTAVDAAFIISIAATGLLARHGVSAPWVTLLRWVSGLMALGLALAPPLTAAKVIGGDVITHGFGPALLFFCVEGLAQFQVRMGGRLRELRKQMSADDRRRADTAEALRSVRTELAEALRRADDAAAEASVLAEQLDAERSSVESSAAAMEALRSDHSAAVEALRSAHSEALRNAAEDKAEALRTLRAKLTTVDLTERRRGHLTSTGAPTRTPTATPPEGSSATTKRTDEECLRAMAEVTTDPLHEWTQGAVTKAAGVGYGRAPRLIEAWPKWATDNLPPAPSAAAAN